MQKSGELTVDTARSLMESGHSDWVIFDEGKFKTTQKAVDDYTQSLENEKEATRQMLEQQEVLNNFTEDYGKQLATLKGIL